MSTHDGSTTHESQRAEMSLTGVEITAIAHALRDAHGIIQRNGGNQYGPLALDDLERLAQRFERETSLVP